MLRLAKAFWDISLWRRTPEQLPASLLLLALVVLATALLEVVGHFLPPVLNDRLWVRIALSVTLPLSFTWAVLTLARRPQRFLQTGTALMGVGVLSSLVQYPADSLMELAGPDSLAALPPGILLWAGLIWYLLACANIWRSALDSGIALGLMVSLSYVLLSILLGQELLLI
jgi:hypothetical protein